MNKGWSQAVFEGEGREEREGTGGRWVWRMRIGVEAVALENWDELVDGRMPELSLRKSECLETVPTLLCTAL